MPAEFRYLFTPIDLGPITLRNRIYATPHATMFTSDERNNLPGDSLAYYCAERAKGGAALVEVSMAIVGDEVGQTSPDTASHFSPISGGHPMILTGRWPLRANDVRIVEGYSKLARKVHEFGGKCFIELASGGTNVGNDKGVTPFPWPSRPTHTLPFTSREMDEKEIETQIEAYGQAAKLVKDSGLDGVDLHGTHGALISEFLSKIMNKRKDRWGGSLENRMRFLEEVIARTKECVNNEIAIGMRLMVDERFEGGNRPSDGAEIARRLDGKLDWITADQGYSPQHEDWQAVPMYVESGYNLPATNPVKAALNRTKLGVVGKYVDPVFAESLIAKGQADMVAMTRALIADPELPNKALNGMLEEIRPCIGTLQDCWGRMIRGLPITCTVNPVVSREKEWANLSKSSSKKRVLIVGAGPAGLEVARITAERGHEVVVYEKSRQVGGQVLIAAKLPGRVDVKSIIAWEIAQLKKLNVRIMFGMDITTDSDVINYVIEEESPDVVVVATGSNPIRTGFQPYTMNEIEGWNEQIVSTDQEIWNGNISAGSKIIIADTLSFIEAPGLAEHLARLGKSVEIVTPHANIALELDLYNQWSHLFPRLLSTSTKISTFSWIRKVEGKSVTIYNMYTGDSRISENIDNLILTTGSFQNDSLYEAFKTKIKEVHLIGDARIGGARIGNAIFDAGEVGRKI